MTVYMYDGINSLAPGIAREFPDATKIAGYDNGRYAWTQADWNLFPHADHIHISVTASANMGDVLDVETGDATPDQTHGWISMRKSAGLFRPTIYCSLDTAQAVRDGTREYILGKDYDMWVARYDGSTQNVYTGRSLSSMQRLTTTTYQSSTTRSGLIVRRLRLRLRLPLLGPQTSYLYTAIRERRCVRFSKPCTTRESTAFAVSQLTVCSEAKR